MTLDQRSVTDGRRPTAQPVETPSEPDALQAGHAELRADVRARRGGVASPVADSFDQIAERIEVSLALDINAPTRARRAVSGWLTGAVAARVLDHCKLIVTELTTNSLRHSGVRDGEVRARVELFRGSIRVEVEDPGSGAWFGPRSPDLASGTGGFGLHLVEALSDRWGIERSTHAGGTRVWSELARDADSP